MFSRERNQTLRVGLQETCERFLNVETSKQRVCLSLYNFT